MKNRSQTLRSGEIFHYAIRINILHSALPLNSRIPAYRFRSEEYQAPPHAFFMETRPRVKAGPPIGIEPGPLLGPTMYEGACDDRPLHGLPGAPNDEARCGIAGQRTLRLSFTIFGETKISSSLFSSLLNFDLKKKPT